MTNKPMRQSKRQITDINELLKVIENCDVCRVAFIDDDFPYIVPMNFGFTFNGKLTLYFHCALEGRKLDIITKNNNVCFEMDVNHKLRTGETACEWSMNYESIIGTGKIHIIDDKNEKFDAFKILMKHYGGEEKDIDMNALEKAAVLKIECGEFTGKRLNK